MEKTKVIVVDDSAFMRKMISDMINEENDIEVIATAKNGEDLIEKLKVYKPDIITLDVEMPVMDGLKTLKNLKRLDYKLKIIMISSVTDSASKITIDCLREGAIDFVTKPSGTVSLDIDKIKKSLVDKIRILSKSVNNERRRIHLLDIKENTKKFIENNNNDYKTSKSISGSYEAIVIAASTGGPRAIHSVIEALPKNLNVPIFVVQHMPKGFTKTFAERLNQNSNLKVVESKNLQSIEKNTVYIAQGGLHMEVGVDKKIYLNEDATLWGVRPAADKLFVSASKVYKSKLLSIVLTGMGRDGAKGSEFIKRNGGHTIAEDKTTSVIYGMPKAAYETGLIDEIIPLYDISKRITELVRRG